MRNRLLISALALGAVMLALACGGSSGPRFDPKRGTEIAHAALFKPEDLPGTGWTTTEDDNFGTADEIPDTQNCQPTRDFNKTADEDVAGKAERQVQMKARNAGESPLTVQLKVTIYHKDDRLPGVMKQYKSTVNDGGTQKCLLDVIKAQLPSNVEISVKQGGAKVPAPEGGAAFSFDVEAKASNDSATVREEHFAWLKGNAAVSLDFQGPPELVTQDLINTTLQKVQAQLETARSAK